MVVSIFNDVIGPVMRGASSSHCAAALRIGRLARDLMDGDITHVLVEFDRGGSLPTTHESQGSDMGLFGGLLGWDAADDRLPDSPAALAAAGVEARIEIIDAHDPHPNTYRLTLRNARETHTLVAISTGGGMMEVISIDGIPVSVGGDYFETLIFAGARGARAGGRRRGRRRRVPGSTTSWSTTPPAARSSKCARSRVSIRHSSRRFARSRQGWSSSSWRRCCPSCRVVTCACRSPRALI